MRRPPPNILALLIYILVVAVGGVAAKSWHAGEVKRAIYTKHFRVAAPPTAAPGSHVSLEYDSYSLGNYLVLEIANLRIATERNRRYYSYGSGTFSSLVNDPANPGSQSTYATELAEHTLQITNCELPLGDKTYSVIGPKLLVIVDQAGNVVSETSLEE